LFKKDFEVGAASRLSKGAERPDQRRGYFDDRQIRSARTEDQIVHGIAEKTDGCAKNFTDFRCVRSNYLQIGAQRQTSAARDGFRCQHGAVARVRENSRYAKGDGTARGKDQSAVVSQWRDYGAIKMNEPHEIIKTASLTEKSTLMSEKLNKYVFRVSPRASKIQIKNAIERLFQKKVVDVNTCNYAGKQKRVRGPLGRRPHWKKAIVTLKEGEKTDLV